MAEGRTAFAVEEHGWYVEPEWVTDYLLDRERLPLHVWDPACGQGNILHGLKRRGHQAWGSDVVYRLPACDLGISWTHIDFLVDKPLDFFAGLPWALVCNPPYGGAKTAEAFIRRGIALPHLTKMCMFLNSKFIFGAGRARGLFSEHPPYVVYPINPRPSCPPGQYLLDGGKAAGGIENFCWIVWIPGWTGQTQIAWA